MKKTQLIFKMYLDGGEGNDSCRNGETVTNCEE